MKITLQIACDDNNIPSKKLFTQWLNACENFGVTVGAPLAGARSFHEKTGAHKGRPYNKKITLRIVDKAESQELNKNFRGKNKPTNVLSFPPTEIPGFKNDSLGDLALCAAIIAEEAAEQNKELSAHWAHMTIHGFLHLLDYDHIENDEAEVMEALEVKILQELGYMNPY